ncbi:MAG: extracellular solute-binding protein, partial [bacterium]|nr:extracellular solute-binding protein [bacterium]
FPLRNEDDFEYVKRRFSEGHVAYFAGEAELLSEFQAALGDKKVRVVPLPAGPVGQSGPILGVNGVMVKANTTQATLEPALAFARYLTENESQNILMEQAKQIPANINIDTGAYPAIAGFLQQARTASVPPIVPQIESVFLWGDDAYYSSLDGQFTPEASVRHLATIANKMNGLTATETLTPQGCDADGTIRFQHSWRGEKSAVLERIGAHFTDLCPGLNLDAEFVAEDELRERLLQISATREAPDIVLVPHTLLADLRREQVVKDILPFIPQTMLLPYRSNVLSGTLRQEGGLYGLPLTCDVAGLFYRAEHTEEPPIFLDELVSSETPLALSLNFAETFWGITAFNGWAFETRDGFPLEQDGFTRWLHWLKTAQDRGEVLTSPDDETLIQYFLEGKAAYLIARAGRLPQLRQAMKEEILGVSLLPIGPEDDEGGSFLFFETFAFPAAVPEERSRRALSFAEFAVSDQAQSILMNEAGLLPVNNLTRVAIDDPAIGNFDDIVEYLSVEWDASPLMQHLQRYGTQVYTALLSGNITVEEVLPMLRQKLDELQEKQGEGEQE